MPDEVITPPHPARMGDIAQNIAAAAGDALLEAVACADMDEIAIRPARLLAVVGQLRAHGFNHLLDIGGVDHQPLSPRFEIAYHLAAIPTQPSAAEPIAGLWRFRIRVFPDDIAPVIPSLSGLWPSADWPEREAYDLFGVRFESHPNLARLLNPVDWVGHPLRKDYPLRGLQRGFVPGGRDGSVPPLNEP